MATSPPPLLLACQKAVNIDASSHHNGILYYWLRAIGMQMHTISACKCPKQLQVMLLGSHQSLDQQTGIALSHV